MYLLTKGIFILGYLIHSGDKIFILILRHSVSLYNPCFNPKIIFVRVEQKLPFAFSFDRS